MSMVSEYSQRIAQGSHSQSFPTCVEHRHISYSMPDGCFASPFCEFLGGPNVSVSVP
jgi:hypothetical protein